LACSIVDVDLFDAVQTCHKADVIALVVVLIGWQASSLSVAGNQAWHEKDKRRVV
jgi:hypothetical protein